LRALFPLISELSLRWRSTAQHCLPHIRHLPRHNAQRKRLSLQEKNSIDLCQFRLGAWGSLWTPSKQRIIVGHPCTGTRLPMPCFATACPALAFPAQHCYRCYWQCHMCARISSTRRPLNHELDPSTENPVGTARGNNYAIAATGRAAPPSAR
jgi:hypothetical protein